MNNKSPRRIPYALGCALILSLHSLTPRSTFAQPSESAREHTAEVASPSATAAREQTVTTGSPRAYEAHASEHTAPRESPNTVPARPANSEFATHNVTPTRADEHTGKITSPSAKPARADEHTTAKASPSARDAHAPSREPVSAEVASVTPSEHSGVVNLNTATAAELERLPRIGPARSQAILALRAKVTRFSKVEQLLRVKGIGRATFRKLRPMLALDGPTTLPERRSR
jgi:competence ComEA-like helix-hairpin-helix protein